MLALFLGAAALILIVLGLQLLAPGNTRHFDGPGGALVDFSSEHGMVIAPGACLKVVWKAEHIQAIYINDTPTVGEGFDTVCVDETTFPILRVEFTDNTEAEFQLPVAFLVEQASTWLLVGAGVLVGLACLAVALARPRAAAASGAGGSGRASRFTRVFAAFGLALTAIVITGLILEFALRFYFNTFGSETQKIEYLYSREQIESLPSSALVLPEIGYGLNPNLEGHNQFGYRGAEIELPKPTGTFRIIEMGGSTTYGTTNPGDETAPYYLQKALRDDYGYDNVEVINAGVYGYTSWQTLLDLTLRVNELQPDLVIIYEAGNDVLPREVDPDCYQGINPYRGLDPRRLIFNSLANVPIVPSALYRVAALSFGWMSNPSNLENSFATDPLGCGGDQDGSDKAHNVEVNRPFYFERNIRDMAAVAHSGGYQIMFSTWPYEQASSDPLPYWRTAVDEHNAITTKVAQELGVLYFDYASVAPPDSSNWSDYVHMTGKGNLDRAQAFAKFLDEQEVINAGG